MNEEIMQTYIQDVITKDVALHDIECLENRIIIEQELIDRSILEAKCKIMSYKNRIEELKEIVKSKEY